MDKIGLIAGNGQLPIVFAQQAKKYGVSVVAIAVEEETDKKLESYVDKIYWISVGQLKKLFTILKQEKIARILMIGQIKHRLLFSDIEIDDELKLLLLNLKDKKTDTILREIANRIEQLGITVIDSTTFIKDLLPPKGVLTETNPTPANWQDIEFGFGIAKAIAGLDIGQTVVIKDKVVLAVEAIEGTDEAIRRGNSYCQGQAVVVKVSKPAQDMRFDIPIVGKRTIDVLITEKIAVLAIEAGKTLLLDKDYIIKEANRNKIAIVAI